MTIPAIGAISISQFNTEYGQAATYAGSLSWIQANAKTGQNTYDMNNYHGKAYFQMNTAGNCNNGNCTSNCNCGDINCGNCVITGTVNCANCDTRAWLQTNCNCACTYNCTYGGVSINCDCDCNCKYIC